MKNTTFLFTAIFLLLMTLLFNSACTTSQKSQVYCPDFRSVKSTKAQKGKYVLKNKAQQKIKTSKRKITKVNQTQKYAKQKETANRPITGFALANNPLLQNAKQNRLHLAKQITKSKLQQLGLNPPKSPLMSNKRLRSMLGADDDASAILDDTDPSQQSKIKLNAATLKQLVKKKGKAPKITRDKIDPDDPYRYAKISEIFMYITIGTFVIGLILALLNLEVLLLALITPLSAIASLVLGIISMKREGDNRVARRSLWVSGIYFAIYFLLFITILILVLALGGLFG